LTDLTTAKTRNKAVFLRPVDTVALLEVTAGPKVGMVALKVGMVVLKVGMVVVLLKEDMVAHRRLVGSMVARLRDIHLRVGISNRDKVVMLRRPHHQGIEAVGQFVF
jgi:hypothetical protein